MGRASSRKKANRATRVAAPPRRPRRLWRALVAAVVVIGVAVALVVLFAGDLLAVGT
jgi:uncharacterized iron-regulated membrane protein